MKRWAILTTALYAIALILLSAPVIFIAFSGWAENGLTAFSESFNVYAEWGYWVWLAVLVAGQFLLLLLPVAITERRLPARRNVQVPILVTAFFLANLFFAGIVSILCALFKEDGMAVFDLSKLFAALAGVPEANEDWQVILGLFVPVFIFWLIWAAIFRRATRGDEPEALLRRATRWLLRGSILEFLIAVPSHIIVRRREDCCAPIGTFWGIVTGISVMLLCFGPGVFYLFSERMKRLQPKENPGGTAEK